MQLQAYLKRENLSYRAFGQRIGTGHGRTVQRYAKGLQIPNRAMMQQIVAATGGEVGPSDFFDPTQEVVAA